MKILITHDQKSPKTKNRSISRQFWQLLPLNRWFFRRCNAPSPAQLTVDYAVQADGYLVGVGDAVGSDTASAAQPGHCTAHCPQNTPQSWLPDQQLKGRKVLWSYAGQYRVVQML